jgi:hypothetical protein
MSDSFTSEAPASRNVPECPVLKNDLSNHPQNDPDEHLPDKQRAAIQLIIMGKSDTAAAKALDLDRRTIYRWRQDERFVAALEERRRALWADAADRVRALVHPSLDVMEQHLCDRYDRARFRAASTILRITNVGKAARMESF